MITIGDSFLNLDHEQSRSFVQEFSKYLEENFNLKPISWNPLNSLHNSEIPDPIKSISHPFLSLNLSFDDINDEKNSFLALAFKQMQTLKPTLLEKNR
jgi:hypothetical protein